MFMTENTYRKKSNNGLSGMESLWQQYSAEGLSEQMMSKTGHTASFQNGGDESGATGIFQEKLISFLQV